MLTMLIVDDHPLYREGVAGALLKAWAESRVLQASSAEEGMRLLEANPATDLALVDLRLPGSDGYVALQEYGARFPQVARVLVSGVEGREAGDKARRCGASGFIPKSMSVQALIGAVRTVLDGGTFFPPAGAPAPQDGGLSLRQIEVLALLSEGMSNKQIARRLLLAERTVKSHVTEVMQRLGVSNRTHAVVEAARRGLVPARG